MGGGGSTYDYGFRIYNPQIARFLSVDPLTKDYPWYTPYQFAGNKPIVAIDLDGKEEYIIHSKYLSEELHKMINIKKMSSKEIRATVERWAKEKKFSSENQIKEAEKKYGYVRGKPIVEIRDPNGAFRIMGWIQTDQGHQEIGLYDETPSNIPMIEFSDPKVKFPNLADIPYQGSDWEGEEGRNKYIKGVQIIGKTVKYVGYATSETGVGAALIPIGGGIEITGDLMQAAGDIEQGNYKEVVKSGIGSAAGSIVGDAVEAAGGSKAAGEIAGDVVGGLVDQMQTKEE